MTKSNEFAVKVTFEGKEITLITDAEITGTQIDGTNYIDAEDGEEFGFEMVANGLLQDGTTVKVYWIFKDIKGERQELDSFDYYDSVDRIEVVD